GHWPSTQQDLYRYGLSSLRSTRDGATEGAECWTGKAWGSVEPEPGDLVLAVVAGAPYAGWGNGMSPVFFGAGVF
ncbi:hypothetical protein, partial [Moorella stamsii (nom. illeg.)]|uniref:hypothetical protein n=1 Tax=Neomoorella stamsii TaxID=1266720 RepID=UPI001B8020D6